jgi:hypothetical protein
MICTALPTSAAASDRDGDFPGAAGGT